ncbi:K(+)-transporting ATPase subunit F [Paenibacillus sp. SC116]|nr:K(+)-transporting ATPase subunit F [Paenibacillus sp. SC116]MCR8846171.1 K(+)-transporting ATPase subunit F [Paenibacillus sp. SC116]
MSSYIGARKKSIDEVIKMMIALGVVVAALFLYLAYALVKPEKF